MKNFSGIMYLVVTNDKFEFPIYVADNISEVSKFLDCSYESVKSALHRDSAIEEAYKIRKVDTREPKDKFNLFEYKAFCEKHKCPLDSFNSIKMFANECYEVCADLCV